METGQSGDLGKSVLKPVDKVAGPEPEPVVTHQVNMEESHVKAMLWIQSCVTLGPVQVRRE